MNYDDTYYPADDAVAEEARFPWPPDDGEPIVPAFVRTWRGAALEPKRFFGAMPDGSIGAALLYYLPLGILVSAATLLWESIGSGIGPEQDAVLDGAEGLVMSPLVQFLFSPLILLVSLFAAAAVSHLMLKIFGGASRPYGSTVRIFAFAYSPQLLGLVPVLGTIVGFVWMIVVGIVGLREGHGTTTGRAAAAVLIPVIVALTFVAIAAFIMLTGRLLTGEVHA